jgi:CubicO group peptidase (beta-lactamase class C family)
MIPVEEAWMKKSCLWMMVALVTAAGAQGQLAVDKLPGDLRQKVDQVAQHVLEETGVPSASLAIVRDGQMEYTQAYGKARLDPVVMATPAMRYSIGSIRSSSRQRRFCCCSNRESFPSTTR